MELKLSFDRSGLQLQNLETTWVLNQRQFSYLTCYCFSLLPSPPPPPVVICKHYLSAAKLLDGARILSRIIGYQLLGEGGRIIGQSQVLAPCVGSKKHIYDSNSFDLSIIKKENGRGGPPSKAASFNYPCFTEYYLCNVLWMKTYVIFHISDNIRFVPNLSLVGT